MKWYTRRVTERRPDRPDWGAATEYLEIDDNGWATRQIEIYDLGYTLKYDRTHWIDFHGELFNLPLLGDRVAGSRCSAHEFDDVWERIPPPSSWELALSAIGPWPADIA